MHIYIRSCLVAATLVLAACSTSDGEDEPFFDRTPPLTRLVLDSCQMTPEDTNPVNIFNATFGDILAAVPESTTPDNSVFTTTCIDNSDTPPAS